VRRGKGGKKGRRLPLYRKKRPKIRDHVALRQTREEKKKREELDSEKGIAGRLEAREKEGKKEEEILASRRWQKRIFFITRRKRKRKRTQEESRQSSRTRGEREEEEKKGEEGRKHYDDLCKLPKKLDF